MLGNLTELKRQFQHFPNFPNTPFGLCLYKFVASRKDVHLYEDTDVKRLPIRWLALFPLKHTGQFLVPVIWASTRVVLLQTSGFLDDLLPFPITMWSRSSTGVVVQLLTHSARHRLFAP